LQTGTQRKVVVVVVRDHCDGGEKEKNLGDFVVSCLVGNDLIPPW
jgi:hypothetical protein